MLSSRSPSALLKIPNATSPLSTADIFLARVFFTHWFHLHMLEEKSQQGLKELAHLAPFVHGIRFDKHLNQIRKD